MENLDSNYVAEEMELYDELKGCTDETELLIIMSRLQEHFLEKLEFHEQQRKLRDEELKDIATDNEGNSDDDDNIPSSPMSTRSATSKRSFKSFKSAKSIKSSKSTKSNKSFKSASAQSSPTPNSTHFDNGDANPFKYLRSNNKNNMPQMTGNLSRSSSVSSKSSKNKMKKLNAPTLKNQNLSVSDLEKHDNDTTRTRVLSLDDRYLNAPSSHNPNGHFPSVSEVSHVSSYRLDLFCDMKFVRKVFVRWISCTNEVLCHVSARTLGILFSHSFLTADQFLDLAELLLALNEKNTPFDDVDTSYRAPKLGAGIYGDLGDDSSTEYSSSDYDSDDDDDDGDGDGDISGDNDGSSSSDSIILEPGLPSNLSNNASKNSNKDAPKTYTVKTPKLSSENGGSYSPRRERKKKQNVSYDVHWDNRLYYAMKVLSLIVENQRVYEGCIVALDEWLSVIVMDLFARCAKKTGFGVLESFLNLLYKILFRFASDREVMGICKLSIAICGDSSALLEIITGEQSTLITRASALELCPLLMITSKSFGSKSKANPEFTAVSDGFSQNCLISILDDGRFNPFEPGDIAMSRTFHRGEHGKLKATTVNPLVFQGQTVAHWIPGMLFANFDEVFIDQESVQRLTFLCVIKSINSLTSAIIENEENAELDSDCGSDGGRSVVAGEFDASTARKIRNFFSRDADYTRERVLELIYEEDDVLIDVLLELLLIETSLRKSKSRLAKRIRYLFDPFMLFHDFVQVMGADYSLLLDLLISSETSFLDYLLRFCKRMNANYHPTPAKQDAVNSVMSILIRLKMHIQNLYQRNLFPYSPKALLKNMEKMQVCYENGLILNETETEMKQNDNTVFDLDYINYMKKKNIAKQEKERKKEELKKEKRKKKPKKMQISSLFLQDVKYAREMKKRNSEIATKTATNLKKRAFKKKEIPNKSDSILTPNTPKLHMQKSVAALYSTQQNHKHHHHHKHHHKHHKKNKQALDKSKFENLKNINFHKKNDKSLN